MAKESVYYTVHLITKVYGPFRLKPDAVKVAMNHATDTRRPKVYSTDGRYVGQVIRVKKQNKRKGYSDYAYQFLNADGTIGNIIPTTGVVQIIEKQWYDNDKKNDAEKYSVFSDKYPYPCIARTNTANKARYLAVQYLSQSDNHDIMLYIRKWGVEIGRVLIHSTKPVQYCYLPNEAYNIKDLPEYDVNVLKSFGSGVLLINPHNGEIIGKR